MDRGREFKGEVSAAIRHEYGLQKKLITTRNPQANAIVESVHKTVHQMIDTTGVKDKDDIDPRWEFQGILSAIRRAVNSTVHTTLRATPSQLVFGRDALLNVSFEADWETIRKRKQRLINYTVTMRARMSLDANARTLSDSKSTYVYNPTAKPVKTTSRVHTRLPELMKMVLWSSLRPLTMELSLDGSLPIT